jgi:hypothetical protein
MPPDARAHRRRSRAITQADPLVTIRYGRLELGATSPVARAPRAHARRAAFLRHQWPYSRRPWSGSAAGEQLRELAAATGIRRRFAPHELRHAHAVEIAGEGVPLNVIQRQLGHAQWWSLLAQAQLAAGVIPRMESATTSGRASETSCGKDGQSCVLR